MRAYADTSVLLTLYFAEASSARANNFMTGQREPLILGPVQNAEFRNGVRLRVAQKRSTSEEAFRALVLFDRDITDGLYVISDLNWSDVFKRFEQISQKYTEHEAHSFADILHIACALEMKAQVFLSFDMRQSKLAKTLGLKTPL